MSVNAQKYKRGHIIDLQYNEKQFPKKQKKYMIGSLKTYCQIAVSNTVSNKK
jgi:hypothetical protein